MAFHCLESHPESIVAKETQRNGTLEHDDRIGVILDTQNTHRGASVFWVSACGTQNQELEGGSAENQAWQGDWSAATKRVDDGWIVEMAIPFRMLRYPKNVHRFGLLFARKKASETNFTTWPYAPPQADNGRIAEYMDEIEGINPPNFAPRPTILPYALGTAGDGNSLRFGLDIKAPITTTMTGVATIKPDFQTVEGAVQDLSFSYTEKFVQDRRPSFAAGGHCIDDPYLFYSQKISDVDYGLKLTGKQGPTTIGVLATAANVGSRQQAQIANVDQELGKYSSIGGTLLENRQVGSFGQMTQMRGSYGWVKGVYKTTFSGNATRVWLDNNRSGDSYYAQVRMQGGAGHVNGMAYLNKVDPNCTNPLGIQGDTDTKGGGLYLWTFQNYPKGFLESYSYNFSAETFSHLNDHLFHRGASLGAEYDFRNGSSLNWGWQQGSRDAFQDRTYSLGLGWNAKSLLSKGMISVDEGRRENKHYRFTAIGQGLPVNKVFSLNLIAGQQLLGTEIENQAILSGTYRIDPMQSFGGRLVAQGGNTNLYLSYGKRTRKGNDLFILIGDPNSETFRHAISLKMVWSL